MRVYTKTAAKDYPEYGIKKGQVYYEWKFYRSRPIKSATYPKESQLTADEDMAEAMRVFEALEAGRDYDSDDLVSMIETIEQCRDNLDSRLEEMPESLRDSSPLAERRDQMEETLNSLESLRDELESAEDEDEKICGSDRIEECRGF